MYQSFRDECATRPSWYGVCSVCRFRGRVDARLLSSRSVRLPCRLAGASGRARFCRSSRRCCCSRWASPTSSSARRPTKSKTACCGSSAAPASLPPKSPADPPPRRRACAPGDMLLAVDGGARHRRANQVLVAAVERAGRAIATPTRCCGSAAREVAEVALAPLPSGAGGALLRARGGRHLHAARRRRGAHAPALRSGDAALLLACGRVLRHVHLLVHRPLRSRRLVLLLGRRRGAALLPPLFLHFALVFPERPHSAATRRCSRAGCPSIYLPAAVLGLDPRSLALLRAGVDPEYFVAPDRAARQARAAAPRGVPRRRSRRPGARARPRPLGDLHPSAALDRLGHGARRAAVRARLRVAVRVRRRAVAADGAARRFRWRSSRSPSHRRSSATA